MIEDQESDSGQPPPAINTESDYVRMHSGYTAPSGLAAYFATPFTKAGEIVHLAG